MEPPYQINARDCGRAEQTLATVIEHQMPPLHSDSYLYVQYPVDGSWEDETLVFDATKDEWEWPSDDAFSSVKVKPTEVDGQVEEEDEEEDEQDSEEQEETETVPTTDNGLNPPMQSLGTSVKVSALRLACHDTAPMMSTVHPTHAVAMQLVLCAVAVGVACFLADSEESEVSINCPYRTAASACVAVLKLVDAWSDCRNCSTLSRTTPRSSARPHAPERAAICLRSHVNYSDIQ